MLNDRNVGMVPRVLDQDALDLSTREVSRMNDASRRMTTFAREGKSLSSLLKVEAGASLHELANAVGPFTGTDIDNDVMAQTATRDYRVANVSFRGVVGRKDGCDAALCIPGVGFAALSLGDDGHGAVLGQPESAGKTCDTAPDHKEIRRIAHSVRTVAGSLTLGCNRLSSGLSFSRIVAARPPDERGAR